MVRVVAKQCASAGYVYAALSSHPGVILLAREAAGSSIPHLDAERVRQVRIPWPSSSLRRQIADLVLKVIDLRDKACDYEQVRHGGCRASHRGGSLMAKVIPIGDPVNDAERRAIAHLPTTCRKVSDPSQL